MAAGLLLATPARAHDSDYSYLRLRVERDAVEGRWEIHLRDARIALGLPADDEGPSAWARLRARAPELRALLGAHLSLDTPEGPCPPVFEEELTRTPDERDYALVRFRARCPAEIGALRVGNSLLFDLDAEHRAFFSAEDAHQTHVGVFHDAQRELLLDIRQLDRWRAFRDYLREGAWHIWLGLDHVLFLLALLLPVPLRRAGPVWIPRESLAAVGRDVVRIVTAFTVSHSLTLALAVFGVLRLPARGVETAIAASVFVAAWNNLRPFLPGRAASLAFGFGLLHGLGFAGALAQLGLPRQARGLALLAFNLGVELGQLAIVAALLPLIFASRHSAAYPRWAVEMGSLGVAWLAALWVIERALGVDLVPFV